ncbi:hypothetical protein F2Q69_00012601 [Brassica cretica]|uniref:Uncharacterized protein n=1 Tax=Brassica cretica TaxID=69181 RepID=A0A8S9QRV2_BRACR|nr:hypothetical protein F2Q69_00012601 [Brassica cretica]
MNSPTKDPWIFISGPEAVYNPEVFKNPKVVLNPEVTFGPRGPGIFSGPGDCMRTRSLLITWTVLRLSRQDCYRYLLGFRILPLRNWPLSSSFAVFYFCRKSLTGLEGAGVGVMTQVPGLRCFPRLEK